MRDSRWAEGRSVLLLVENQSVPRDRRVWQQATALRDAGADVFVVCPRGAVGEREGFEERDGIRIHRFALEPSAGGLAGYVREYARALRETRRLVRSLVRARRFDVVQAANPPDVLLFTALAARWRGAALVFDHHDLVPELFETKFARRDPVYWLTRLAERATFALADVVLSTNGSYRDVAVGRGGKQPADVFVVRNAPDARGFRADGVDALGAGGEHTIAYLGIMGPQDGVDHALRALAILGERRSDWHGVFVGDGESLPELRRLAEDLGLAERVTFAGWVEPEQVAATLRDATVCLVPDPKSPLSDASSLVKVIEYMALGRPIAAYDLKETRVTAGDAALYATPNEPRSLAEQVGRLLDDQALRDRLGAVGRERVANGLSWEDARAALAAAYRRAFAVADARRSTSR
jgi:glycosyltransferase involved in cell wall biosynthesis